MRAITTLTVASLLLVGCSGSPAPAEPASPIAEAAATATPAPDLSTVAGMRNALIAGGYDCPAWKESNRVTKALQSGSCSDGDVFSVYLNSEAVQEAVETLKSFGAVSVVVGDKWIANVQDEDLDRVHGILGGTIVRSDDKEGREAEDRQESEQTFFLASLRALSGIGESDFTDAQLLNFGAKSCEFLGGANGYEPTVDAIQGMAPQLTAKQAGDVVIEAVSQLCPEHGGELPS